MTRKQGLIVFALLSTTILSSDDGKAVFKAKKCMKCHTVNSQQIATTSQKADSEITDLSNTGRDIDSETLRAYLKKETQIKGKIHKVKYRGDQKDFDALVTWLMSLKDNP